MVWVWAAWMAGSVAVAGPAPELPQVMAQIAPLRAQRAGTSIPPLSEADLGKVVSGEVVTGLLDVAGSDAKASWGVAVLDVPISRLWAAISDESMHPRYTSLSYAELVSGTACASGRHVLQVLDVGVPMVEDRWWVTIRTHTDALAQASSGKVRELTWTNAKDGHEVTSEAGKAAMADAIMLGFTRGSWFLAAVNDHQTLVEYSAHVDPGGKLSPTLMSWFAGKSIRRTLDDMVRIANDPKVSCIW
ncbi:MAG: hypothetical protein H6733_17595 [Alphaproteobacteria bacterium]|nr:hypothetical protein [Alphaproteobacteria bacterium]